MNINKPYSKILFVVISSMLFIAPRVTSVIHAEYSNYNQTNGTIMQTGGLEQTSTPCLYNATISWQSNFESAKVYVKIIQTGEEQLFSQDTNSTQSVDWISAGHDYVFSLYDTSYDQYNFVSNVTIYASHLSCAPSYQTLQNTETTRTTEPVYSNTLILNTNNSYCVNQTTTYYVDAGANMAYKSFSWITKSNGSTYSSEFQLDGSGKWSGTSNTWQNSQIGNWTKRVELAGMSKEINFDVKNCGSSNYIPDTQNTRPTYTTPQPTQVQTQPQVDFTLTSNSNNGTFCVGQTPTYTINSSGTAPNATINWNSINNNGNTSNNVFYLNSSGSWTASGMQWQYNDRGTWTKYATLNGVNKSITFEVVDCSASRPTTSTPTPVAQPTYTIPNYNGTPLSCKAVKNPIKVNELVEIIPVGGTTNPLITLNNSLFFTTSPINSNSYSIHAENPYYYKNYQPGEYTIYISRAQKNGYG